MAQHGRLSRRESVQIPTWVTDTSLLYAILYRELPLSLFFRLGNGYAILFLETRNCILGVSQSVMGKRKDV